MESFTKPKSNTVKSMTMAAVALWGLWDGQSSAHANGSCPWGQQYVYNMRTDTGRCRHIGTSRPTMAPTQKSQEVQASKTGFVWVNNVDGSKTLSVIAPNRVMNYHYGDTHLPKVMADDCQEREKNPSSLQCYSRSVSYTQKKTKYEMWENINWIHHKRVIEGSSYQQSVRMAERLIAHGVPVSWVRLAQVQRRGSDKFDTVVLVHETNWATAVLDPQEDSMMVWSLYQQNFGHRLVSMQEAYGSVDWLLLEPNHEQRLYDRFRSFVEIYDKPIPAMPQFVTDSSELHIENGQNRNSPFLVEYGRERIKPTGSISLCYRQQMFCKWQQQDMRPTGQRLSLTPQRWKEIYLVNVFVNEIIKPRHDQELFGKDEYWDFSGKLEGDCDEYMIAKWYLLKRLGLKVNDMAMTTASVPRTDDPSERVGHGFITLRTTSGDLVLDNLRNDIVFWNQLPEYRYMLRVSPHNGEIWLKLYGQYQPSKPSIPFTLPEIELPKWQIDSKEVSDYLSSPAPIVVVFILLWLVNRRRKRSPNQHAALQTMLNQQIRDLHTTAQKMQTDSERGNNEQAA